MSDPERDKTMVQELLELKSKVDGIIVNAFNGNAQFQNVVREGFESVVNRRQNRPAELIGKECIYMFYMRNEKEGRKKQASKVKQTTRQSNMMVLFKLFAAKYVDLQLRSGNKEWTDEEMERLMDRVMVLFRFIHGVCEGGRVCGGRRGVCEGGGVCVWEGGVWGWVCVRGRGVYGGGGGER